jgi:hypothetical protein
MYKNNFIIIAISFLSVANAADGIYKDIEEIPIAECSIQKIQNQQILISTKKISEYSKYKINLTNELIELTKNAKDNKRSVGEQFKQDQLLAFERNRNAQIVISLRQLIEGDRERDIGEIKKLLEIADRVYRFGDIYDKKDSAYNGYLKIITLRNYYEKTNLEANKNWDDSYKEICSVSYALNTMTVEPIKLIDSLEIEKLGEKVKEMLIKYNLQTIDRSKFTDEDKRIFDSLYASKLEKYSTTINYLKDLQNLKLLDVVSRMKYKTLKEDLDLSGGDSRQYGERLKKIFSDPKVNPKLSYSYAMLNLIEKENPSYIAKQQQDTAIYIKSISK